MLIGLVKGLTRIDFIFLRSRSKRSLCKKQRFPLIFLRTFYHKAFISYVLIGLSVDKANIDFWFTVKCQGHNLKNLKIIFAHYHENLLLQRLRFSHNDWSW